MVVRIPKEMSTELSQDDVVRGKLTMSKGKDNSRFIDVCVDWTVVVDGKERAYSHSARRTSNSS